jgi:diguanylate cyclase (GGDEF)-like protein
MPIAHSKRTLPVLVTCAVVLALICVAVAVVAAVRAASPSPLALLGGLLLVFAGVRLHLPIRLGSQRVELAWGEAGLILALAMVPSPWVVLLTPIAVAINFGLRRLAAVKILFNAATYTAAAGAAAGILAVAGASRPFSEAELPVLAVAGAAAGIVTYLAVAAVIATVQQMPLLATWRASPALQLLTLGGNLTVGVGVVELARYNLWAVVALPVVALCLHQGYEGRVRGHQEREAGQQHAAAVGRLTKDLDEPGVLRRATEDACALADADVVEVELPAHGEVPAVLYRFLRRGEPWTGDPAAAPALPARVVAEFPVPTDDGAGDGRLRAWLIGGAPDLRLGEFKETALRSLAEHAGAAVRNARIHALQTYHATHDRLTRLPARSLLVERIEAPLRAGIQAGGWNPVALLVIDVTGYGEIVRTLGHDVAEELLVRTARRLEIAADGDEFVAHVGTDTFGIYLPATSGPAHVRDRALRLLAAVRKPILLDTTDLPTTQVTLAATAGAAYSLTPIGSGTELLRQASVALDRARATNIDLDFYDPAVDEMGGPAAIVLRSELRAALDGNQLDLHYQPILHLPSGAPVAMEALLRWQHPTKGLLYAGEFMTVLEHSPDHARFVAWQLDRALTARRTWGERNLPVSINFAARCLLDRRFPDQVAMALRRVGMPGDQLMVEIDETAVLTQFGLVGDVLIELRLLGVRIAIDNLGTGTSSLFGLLKVPATHVKVDGHFVRQMLIDPEAMAVVGMGLDLGRRADLQFVATGVNADEQIAALRQRGCDTAQGPLLVRPLLADEIPRYLALAPEVREIPRGDIVALDSRRRSPAP